jgi:hypothetical protein
MMLNHPDEVWHPSKPDGLYLPVLKTGQNYDYASASTNVVGVVGNGSLVLLEISIP